jgi:hypothetical protein
MGIVSLAAAVVLFAAFCHLRAQEEKRPSTATSLASAQVEPQTSELAVAGVPHRLLATYVNHGNLDGELQSGTVFLPLDSLTSIKCPNPTGCTLEVEQNVEVGGVTYADNGWVAFPLLDGGVPGASYIFSAGNTLTDGNNSVGTCDSTFSMTYGTHTVRTLVASTYGVRVYAYNINYRVYAP